MSRVCTGLLSVDLYPPYILRPVCQHTRGHVPSVSAYEYGGLGGIRSMLIHQVEVSTVYVPYDLNHTLQIQTKIHKLERNIRNFEEKTRIII